MWILASIVILAVIIVLGLFFLRKKDQKMRPMEKGMALGGLVGVLIGIALVEIWGYEYPVPAILWMLGMAGGQLIGWLYDRKKK